MDDDDDLLFIDDDDDNDDNANNNVNANSSSSSNNNNNNNNNNNSNAEQHNNTEQPSMQRASEQAAKDSIARDEDIKAQERAIRAYAGGKPDSGPSPVSYSANLTKSHYDTTTTTMASPMAASEPDVVAGSIQLEPESVIANENAPSAKPSASATAAGSASPRSHPDTATVASPHPQRRMTAQQQQDAKMKAQMRASRNAAMAGAVRVGAVSVSTPNSPPPHTVDRYSARSGYGRRSDDAHSPVRVGAVSVSHAQLDDATVATSQTSAEELAQMSPNSRREHQDEVAKSRARRTARRLNHANGGSATSTMSTMSTVSATSTRNTMHGGSGGSVIANMNRSVASAVAGTVLRQSQPQRNDSDDAAGLRPVTTATVNKPRLTRDEMDRQAKLRASRGRVSAKTPVPAVGAIPSNPSSSSVGGTRPSHSTELSDGATLAPVTTSSIRHSAREQQESDRQSKIRASAGGRTASSVQPGAVAVAPVSGISGDSANDDDDGKYSSKDNRPTSGAHTAEAGYTTRLPRNSRRRGGNSASMHGDDASVMTSDTDGTSLASSMHTERAVSLEDRARRKIEAATGGLGRTSRHRLNNTSIHSASQDQATARAYRDSQPAPLTIEQQREQRMQEKMAQMGPQSSADTSESTSGPVKLNEKSLLAEKAIRETMDYYERSSAIKKTHTDAAVNPTKGTQPDDSLRRLNAKMEQMHQQEIENENRARAMRGEDPLEEPASSSGAHLNKPAGSGADTDPAIDRGAATTIGMHSDLDPLISSGGGGVNSNVITTTAARGMAAAPDVEYGEMQIPMLGDENLAVAIAIDSDEEEEPSYLPKAVVYNPEAKPPLYRNRRVQLYIIGGILICLTIILLVLVIMVVLPSDESSASGALTILETPAPTGAPTSQREGLFRNYFANLVGSKVFEAGTPHYLAASWMLDDDPASLEVDADNFFQRYMLAFLYFATTASGTKQWRSCGRPVDDDDEECVFQRFERNLTDDSIFYVNVPGRTRWLSSAFECEWEGVDCSNDPSSRSIYKIKLFGQNLTGMLPSELSNFPLLQHIALAYNDLTGTLPTEYASMEYLGALEVHGNQLTGSIPEVYYEADGSMALLNVGENRLEGTISTQIARLTGLKGYHIFSNNFHGTIPTEIGKLRSLSFARLSFNDFEGVIPTQIGRLTQLNELWLQENGLSGTIPSELGRLRRMTDLRIADNSMIGGTIPTELYELTRLTKLLLEANDLTGSLSTLVGKLTLLEALRVSRNRLTGSIPLELASLSSMRLAWMHLNEMTGSMPLEICDRQQGLIFEFLQTDCNPIDDPAVPCECCSACCNRDTRLCYMANGKEIDA